MEKFQNLSASSASSSINTTNSGAKSSSSTTAATATSKGYVPPPLSAKDFSDRVDLLESSGDLLHAKLSMPKGSPLRARLQDLGAMIEEAVFAWTDRFKEPEPEPVRRIKLVLAALDTEVYALPKAFKQKDGSVDAALATVSPLADECLRGLKGEPRPPPAPPREPMSKVLQMLYINKYRVPLI